MRVIEVGKTCGERMRPTVLLQIRNCASLLNGFQGNAEKCRKIYLLKYLKENLISSNVELMSKDSWEFLQCL